MIDWLTIAIALGIIATLVGIFGFVAWKINMSEPLVPVNTIEKKSKYENDQPKKKPKSTKKPKRENKEEDQERPVVKFVEPSTQTNEDADNEREESDQESSTPPPQVVETSSKPRRRPKKKSSSSDHIEGILVNKDEKSPVTDRPKPIPHPKLAAGIPKDEVELAKQHQQQQQQSKTQGKSNQASIKPTVAAAPPPPPPIPVRRLTPSASNTNQKGAKQQQTQEQPFTTVGGNRHKTVTPPSQQQQQQQQQQKPVTVTSSAATVTAPTNQQQTPVQAQHEQLAQRQPVRQQKETPTQLNGFNTNATTTTKQSAPPTAQPTKLVDIVKALPTSQAVVIELMTALDAVPFSSAELDIIMHKIANKQSVVKQDWSKLQHGQKVDPQAHIGQALDESARAYEEDMQTNAIRHIKELTDELNNDKSRMNELIKESSQKDLNIQVLQAQLNACQQPQQQLQTYQVEFKRLNEENMQLKQRLTQQQQQFSSMNLINNNTNTNNTNNGDSSNVQLRVLSDQIKKLSVDNGNLEKQVKAKESLFKDVQKEKDDLIRTNQQLAQKNQESQKQFKLNEDKILKELEDIRTTNLNQLNEYKRRVEQLELEKEQIKQTQLVQAEPPTINNEEREKLEQLNQENEQLKKQLADLQNQYQSQDNELRQEIERIKKEYSEQRQQFETINNETAAKNTQLESLRGELEQAKAANDSLNSQSAENLRQEQDKQKQFLVQLLEEDVRNQLSNDNQDFNQWLSSYRQIFESSIESKKRALQDELTALKRENDQLHQNMKDVESQLKEIEQTVQSKEESLLSELKNKDVIVDNLHVENEQLNGEIQRLRTEIERLQSAQNEAINDIQTLKLQLDDRHLLSTNSPSTTADESYEFIKQPSPSSAEIDTRAEELHELIRSSKQALENQDSIVQQLDKRLNEIHPGGTGEIQTTNVDESTVSSSSNQQQQQEQQQQQQDGQS